MKDEGGRMMDSGSRLYDQGTMINVRASSLNPQCLSSTHAGQMRTAAEVGSQRSEDGGATSSFNSHLSSPPCSPSTA